MNRPRIILESPFRKKGSGDADPVYLVYLRRALRDAWDRGEHPLASHAYYPFFLNESDPIERLAGIEAGYSMWPFANFVAFYTDYGMSAGMESALDRAAHRGMETRVRSIGINP